MKIRTKLFLLLLVAAGAPVAISGIFSTAISQRALERSALELMREQAAATAEIAERAVNESFNGLLAAERYLPIAKLRPEERDAALRLIYRQFDRFNVVALFDETGTSVVAPVYDENPSRSAEIRNHEPVSPADIKRYSANVPLAAALASGRALGSIYHSEAGLPRVVLALRVAGVRRRPPQRGVLAVELSLGNVAERLSRPAGTQSRAFLVDTHGRVLVSGDPKVAPGTQLANLGRTLEAAGPQALATAGGGGQVVGVAPLPALGWAVVLQQPRAVALAAPHKLRQQVIFWTAVSALAALLVAIFFGQTLARPVIALVDSARLLAGGTFKRLHVRSRDELGQLSATFNEMAGAIELRDREIRAWNEELQTRVDERTRELKEAQDQLIESRKLAAVAGLGAGAAHEINNPLFVVQGMSELLLMRHATDPGVRELAETIHGEAKRIGRIVSQLQTLTSAPQRGRRDRIDLNRLLDDVLDEQQRALAELRIAVVRDYVHPLPLVGGNRQALVQALVQIIDNARQAMPFGGTLTVSTQVIDGAAVRVGLGDTGGGIPAELLPRVFEPFFTTKGNWSGTGMGLALVHKTLDDHAGSVKVESQVGKGTRILLTFPVLAAKAHLV